MRTKKLRGTTAVIRELGHCYNILMNIRYRTERQTSKRARGLGGTLISTTTTNRHNNRPLFLVTAMPRAKVILIRDYLSRILLPIHLRINFLHIQIERLCEQILVSYLLGQQYRPCVTPAIPKATDNRRDRGQHSRKYEQVA